MGSSAPASTSGIPPEFLAAFRARAGDRPISFAAFVELALYHPEAGYYIKKRARIGTGPGTDFFTATSTGPVFAELVIASCVELLGGERRAAEYTFVEIGAEGGNGILKGRAHPFRACRVIPVGDALRLEGSCIVFSNELFDAQPFRRFRFRDGAWRELGVANVGNALQEIEIPAEPLPAELPAEALEGYIVDFPGPAKRLLEEIVAQAWSGLFLAFDYGKTWQEIIEACPEGTARIYHRHRQGNDLLAQPGEQDITCHVCWDWLEQVLAHSNFVSPAVVSQESFLMHHAGDAIANILQSEAARVSPRKLALMQLLHPANLGQKFQVLHAIRPEKYLASTGSENIV